MLRPGEHLNGSSFVRRIYSDIKDLVVHSVVNWFDDNIPLHAAALAFYTIFSLAPLLILTIAATGFLFSQQASLHQVTFYLRDTLGSDIADNIIELLNNTQLHRHGVIATVIGIGILLFGSTTVIHQLKNSLNKIFNIIPKPGNTIRTYIFSRTLSLVLIIFLTTLMIFTLLLQGAFDLLQPLLTSLIPFGASFWSILNRIGTWVITFILFAMIFKLLPDAKIRWWIVLIGALITTCFFEIGKVLVGIYFSIGRLETMYGAAGSFVIFLVWVYYNALAVYLGAEFTHALIHKYSPSIETSKHTMLSRYPDSDNDVDPDALA